MKTANQKPKIIKKKVYKQTLKLTWNEADAKKQKEQQAYRENQMRVSDLRELAFYVEGMVKAQGLSGNQFSVRQNHSKALTEAINILSDWKPAPEPDWTVTKTK